MNYLFLTLILLSILLISIVAQRIQPSSTYWRPFLFATAIGGFLNVILAYGFSTLAILNYKTKYLSSISLGAVPLEQVLLSFLLPGAFVTLYQYLNNSRPLIKPDKYSLSISNVLMGLCVAMIFFAYNKGFTIITFSLLLFTLFFVEYKSQLRFMLKFYRSYVFSLIAFLLIFIPLHTLSIYNYATVHTIELEIAYIHFESYFCFLAVSLISTFSYEFFKRKL
jgi:hypothetical protein